MIAFIERFKAGSPTEPSVFWVSKKPKELAKLFNQEYEDSISHGSFKRLLIELGYGYRKQSKQLATGTYCRRNEQSHRRSDCHHYPTHTDHEHQKSHH